MWVWLDRVGLVLFDASLSTAILSSFVILAMLVCRQPSKRISIARAGLLASLLMMPVVAFAPLPRLDVIDVMVRSGLVPAHVIRHLEQTGQPAAQRALTVGPSQSLAADYHRRVVLTPGPWLGRGLTMTALSGMGLGLAWLLLGFWVVRRWVRDAREPSSCTQQRYNQLFPAADPRRLRPALRVTPRVAHPVVVVGLFRPTILIPPKYDELESDADLVRLSLLHEIAHAERADAWFGTLAGVAQAVWFFLPQTWWLRSQLLIDQEFMADHSAALRYGTTLGYAASLLSLAGSRTGQSDSSPRSGRETAESMVRESERRSPLFQRVLMLLYCPFRVEPRVRASCAWALRTTVAVASIMAACLCLRWPHAQAIEARLKQAKVLALEPLRIADFVAEPLVVTPGGRGVPHVLPVLLPDRFELTVDVFASATDLSKIRIAGYSLGAATTSGRSAESIPGADDSESWHTVRLRRQDDQVLLSLNGQTVVLSPVRRRERLALVRAQPRTSRPVSKSRR